MKAKNYKNANEIITKNSLTEKEVEIVKLLNDQLSSYFGETYSDIDCNDIAELLKWKVGSVKGVVGSLVKKNILGTFDTGTGYEVVYFLEQAEMSFYHFNVEDFQATPVTPEQKQSAHKVGDIHKNGLWSWTEYKPGKFDWRVIKVK